MLVSRRHFVSLMGGASAFYFFGCGDGGSVGGDSGSDSDSGSGDGGPIRPADSGNGGPIRPADSGNGEAGPLGGDAGQDAPPLPSGTTKVLWLQGSACSGCSIAFLNLLGSKKPTSAADVLLEIIDLRFHQTLMGASGDLAVSQAEQVLANAATDPFVLIVEGGVPNAYGGFACAAWNVRGKDEAFKDVVARYAAAASAVVSVGTCASFGGVAASGSNPTQVVPVKTIIGKQPLNISGCPPHPDWIVYALSQLLTVGLSGIPVDSNGRPTAIFGRTIHNACPFDDGCEASTLADNGCCLEELGCRGKNTRGDCPTRKFNGGTNWCIGAGTPCIGCTEPTFPAQGRALFTVR